jgi:hypothetical protein
MRVLNDSRGEKPERRIFHYSLLERETGSAVVGGLGNENISLIHYVFCIILGALMVDVQPVSSIDRLVARLNMLSINL